MTAASPSNLPSNIPQADIDSFVAHFQQSKRIIALVGAGLSASSGLATFRGAGGLWRRHDAMMLATPEAFAQNPALVWQFYNYRRHMSLKAKPNRAHFALAELARKRKGFITVTQNVDGLSPRANHPMEQIFFLHGSLFDLRCTGFYCRHTEINNFTDPVVPALAIPTDDEDAASAALQAKEQRQQDNGADQERVEPAPQELDISDANVALPDLPLDALPHCPECKTGLLRPGVVWFGEALPKLTIEMVDDWIDDGPIDLVLVIGTSSKVYPAAGYSQEARQRGARVAVFNIDRNDEPSGGMRRNDWFFEGDAAVILPELLKSVIGEIGDDGSVVRPPSSSI